MFWIILGLTLILAAILIVMVLLQPSKGGGITAAFGGIGGSLGSTFGQRRTLEALGKGTTYTALAIAVLCIVANLFFVPQGGGAGPERVIPTTTGQQAPNVQRDALPGTGGLQEQGPSAPATEGAGDAAPAEGAPSDAAPATETPAPNGE